VTTTPDDQRVPTRKSDDTTALSIWIIPTSAALARLVSTLHSRGANVSSLHWRVGATTGEPTVVVHLGIDCTRQLHLQRAIERMTDVVRVEVQTKLSGVPRPSRLSELRGDQFGGLKRPSAAVQPPSTTRTDPVT
jgi:hypothetical protein